MEKASWLTSEYVTAVFRTEIGPFKSLAPVPAKSQSQYKPKAKINSQVDRSLLICGSVDLNTADMLHSDAMLAPLSGDGMKMLTRLVEDQGTADASKC